MKRITCFVFPLVFLLGLSLNPGPVLAQTELQCEFEYTVQVGDWLSKIADKYYDNPQAIEQILQASNIRTNDVYTNIADPDQIEPGWQLCIPADGDPNTGPTPPPAGLAPEALANVEYQTQWTNNGSAKLENGFYSEPGPPDANFATSVRLEGQFTAYGQLNGQDIAAVILVIEKSGAGRLYDLALVTLQNGQPVNIATVHLGNRVKINAVSIEDDLVRVDMLAHGDTDHLCCPSQRVVRSYSLQPDQLVQSGEEQLGTVILAADLSPETLRNLTYQSDWTQSGEASLVNGEYREPAAQGSATETVVTMDPRTTSGQLNGQNGAAVILITDPGGSGTFYDLAVVVDQAGQPVNVATIFLGDRIQLLDLRIEENEVIANMMTHPPNTALSEPPAQQEIRHYALQAEALIPTVNNTAGIFDGTYRDTLLPQDVTIDSQGLAQVITGTAVPASPYNACCPPGPIGLPDHLSFSFDNEVRMSIYPIEAYEAQWNAAGNSTITNVADRLRELLAGTVPEPGSGLPLLQGSRSGQVGRWAQYQLLDFGSGQGIRYIADSPNRQDAGPITNETIASYFQGLTSDGQYYVSLVYPTTSAALPNTFDDVPEATKQRVFNPESNNAYIQETLAALDALPPTDWVPPLNQLDAMAQSITLNIKTAAAGSSIVGRTWQWVEFQDTAGINDITVDRPEQYTLTLQPDGQYAFQADCNNGSGAYALNGSSLTLAPGPVTLANCGPESLSDQYLRLLGDVVTYVSPDDGSLVLNLMIDAGNMVFQ